MTGTESLRRAADRLEAQAILCESDEVAALLRQSAEDARTCAMQAEATIAYYRARETEPVDRVAEFWRWHDVTYPDCTYPGHYIHGHDDGVY